jgi:hypothetical protein
LLGFTTGGVSGGRRGGLSVPHILFPLDRPATIDFSLAQVIFPIGVSVDPKKECSEGAPCFDAAESEPATQNASLWNRRAVLIRRIENKPRLRGNDFF